MHRSKREEEKIPVEVKNPICERFETPLGNRTFFSPLDTAKLKDTYPAGIECTVILEG